MSAQFAPWIKHFPATGTGPGAGSAAVLFPHAGGAAQAYRKMAKALAENGTDAFILQYPQRADRLTHPPADTVDELAGQLFEAGSWGNTAPLQLFGHCMGATVAFEFARIAERNGIPVEQLWASAGQAPCTVAESPPLPTSDAGVLADMVDLGGTDPRLLDDEDFVELLMMAVKADYRALDGYSCAPDVRIGANIHALGGRDDHRVSAAELLAWQAHTAADFRHTEFDGGHFYLDKHLDRVVELVSQNGG